MGSVLAGRREIARGLPGDERSEMREIRAVVRVGQLLLELRTPPPVGGVLRLHLRQLVLDRSGTRISGVLPGTGPGTRLVLKKMPAIA